MPDVKISALPAAGTLAGANVLPLVQGASTTKVSLTQLDTRWVGAATGGTVNGGLTVNPYLAVGTNPAQSGTIRVPNNGGVYWRNGAGTGDIAGVKVDTNNTLDLRTSGTYVTLTMAGATAFFTSGRSGTSGSSWEIGTNPAATGIVRLPYSQYIVARNTANTADIPLIGTGAGDLVYLPSTFVIGDGKDVILGGTTGTKIGTLANHKLAFYGATPIVRPTGTPAAATDPATTMALVNSLRASLIALGLIS